jgi:hypothetical protein
MALLETESRRQAAVLAVAWACFTSMVLLVVHHHEPWFDEAQAWLIARNNSLFEMLFQRLHYEGTPGLWHLLLWPLAKSGAPYWTMSYLSVLIASVSAGLVLFFAPFPVWLRVLFVFGYYPAYQYSVVARSYGLNLLLIILAAILYSTQASKPLRYCLILAALANTNVFGFLVAGVLFAEFALMAWRSRWAFTKRFAIPAFFFVIASLLAVAQAAPARDVVFRPYHDMTPIAVIGRASGQIVRGFMEVGPPISTRLTMPVVISVGILIVGLGLAAKAKKLTLTILVCGAPLAFQALKHAEPWHAGLIYLSWVFGIWISWPVLNKLSPRYRRDVVLTIALLFVVHVYDALAAWRADWRDPYSPAPQAAMFLKDYFAAHANHKLACTRVVDAFAVQPYFKQNICANYYGGTPELSYYDFKSGQPIPIDSDPQYVTDLMRTGRFDALLVPTHSLRAPEYDVVARQAGYCCVRSFAGEMVWKDYDYFLNDLLVFERCAAPLPGASAK